MNGLELRGSKNEHQSSQHLDSHLVQIKLSHTDTLSAAAAKVQLKK